MTRVLAFDFGASSGRAIVGTYDGRTLDCREVHRFENRPRAVDGRLRWDFDGLMAEVRLGIDRAGPVDGIGFDTWGVDFGLLDHTGARMEDPVHYRDARCEAVVEQVLAQLPADMLYAATGNQIMPINTLFRLVQLKNEQPERWARVARVLFLPDLLAYTLCGAQVCERSIASTSQMLDPMRRTWSDTVLDRLGLTRDKFAPLVDSGTVIGRYGAAQVIAVAGHDTQCAVAAMPAHEGAAFLSCGTWSLLGCEQNVPILSRESSRAALSNELGANGKINYLKNIIGLWLIQESRRQWAREGQAYSYAELEQLALAEPGLRSLIDPDAPDFATPGDVPARIRAYCRATGQPEPQSVGQVMRCIYDSLALKYRFALDQLQRATGRRFSALHVLGGGAKDGLLCRMTADCIGIPVLAGPVEATALGNVLIQLVALGALPSLDEGRRLIAHSQTIRAFAPEPKEDWDKAYAGYQSLLAQGGTK